MITKTKIRQLEEKCRQVSRSHGKAFVFRDVTSDGSTYIDKVGNPLSEAEVKQIEKENKEIQSNSGIVIFVKSPR